MIQDSKEMIRMDEEGDGGLMRRFRSTDRYMRNRRVFAVLAVTIMLTAAAGCSVMTEETEESDAFAISVTAAFIIGAAIFGGGFLTGYGFNDWWNQPNEDTQAYTRLAVVQDLNNLISVADSFAVNAMNNYAQIWGMTKEHWVRQAELEAYALWSSTASYSSQSIFTDSYIYENAATMNANAVTQLNYFYNALSAHFASLKDKEAYEDKVDMAFNMSSLTISSDGTFNWNAQLASVVSATSSARTVFIGDIEETYINSETSTSAKEASYEPGFIYNPGSATTIRSGTITVSVPSGVSYVKDLTNFKPGVYTLSSGTTLASDVFVQSVGDSAYMPVKAGLIMEAGGTTALGIWNGSGLSYNGTTYKTVKIDTIAKDTPADESTNIPEAIDITDQLSSYQSLLDKIYWVNVSANNAAAGIWALYNEMNSKNYTVTTLMYSYNYKWGTFSEGMNEAATLSALSQLGTWYQENGGDVSDLNINLYSTSTNTFFMRGTIYDEYGEVQYNDVIFTPLFQSNDTRPSVGDTVQIDQNTVVQIWGTGQELTTWYNANKGAVKLSDNQSVMLNGGSFKVTQILKADSSGGKSVSSIELPINKVRYVDAENIDINPSPDPEKGNTNWLKIIAIAAGAILSIYGLVSRRFELVIFGVLLLAFGLLLADTVWNRLMSWDKLSGLF